jgi:uncharacterized YigZ family protein
MANNGDRYPVIKAPAEGLFKDRGSRFLAYAFPAESEERFRETLENIRRKHHGARHYCYAFRLSPDDGLFRYSDDGEPSGTAGRPIYEQILSAGVYETGVVVVRYFGGILLGTGGLHNAYKQAAANALARAEIIEKVLQDDLVIRFGYEDLNRVMQIIDKEKLQVTAQDFGTDCSITVRIPRSETGRITARLERSGKIYVVKAQKKRE